MEFWSYYRLFRRRRSVVVAAVLAAVAAAVVINQPGMVDYEASATLSVPSEQRTVFVFGAPDQAGPGFHVAAALNLLRSRDLAERTVAQFRLPLSPDDLQRRLKAERDRTTGFIRVTVTGRTPDEAVTLTNAVAQTAAAYDQEVRGREGTVALGFVEKQVDAARVNLRRAEDALLQFRQKNQFLLDSAKGQQVAALQAERQRVDLALKEMEAKLAANRAQMNPQGATRSDREIMDSPIAQQLRAQLVGLEVALTSELAVHTPSHPNVVALKVKIEAVKDRLNAERAQHNPIYDALAQDRIKLTTEREALVAEQRALGGAMAAIQRELPGLAQIQMEETQLTRNVTILDRQYGDLQAQMAQTRLKQQEARDLGSLAVVDLARTARVPSLGTKLLRVLLASLLGLLGGGAVAYFLDYLDNGLRTPENAERLLGVPALAAIPYRNPSFEEAYRLLQANMPPPREGEAPVIAVTSPRPGAGTSTIVANLARAFARDGRRTLVVDAAFQRPTQHAAFGVPNNSGLAQVLVGEATLQDALVKTETPNLWMLPSGSGSGRISGRLGSPTMVRLLDDLRRRADVILLDTPPVGAFADTLAVAPLVRGVLLVLDARQAPRGVEERAKVQLDRAGAKILGFALTKVRSDLVDSYVYQQRYYRGSGRRMPFPAAAATALGLALAAGYFSVNPWYSPFALAHHGVAIAYSSLASAIRTVAQWHLPFRAPHVNWTGMVHTMAQWRVPFGIPQVDWEGVVHTVTQWHLPFKMPHMSSADAVQTMAQWHVPFRIPHVDWTGVVQTVTQWHLPSEFPHVNLAGVVDTVTQWVSSIPQM